MSDQAPSAEKIYHGLSRSQVDLLIYMQGATSRSLLEGVRGGWFRSFPRGTRSSTLWSLHRLGLIESRIRGPAGKQWYYFRISEMGGRVFALSTEWS